MIFGWFSFIFGIFFTSTNHGFILTAVWPTPRSLWWILFCLIEIMRWTSVLFFFLPPGLSLCTSLFFLHFVFIKTSFFFFFSFGSRQRLLSHDIKSVKFLTLCRLVTKKSVWISFPFIEKKDDKARQEMSRDWTHCVWCFVESSWESLLSNLLYMNRIY